MEDTTTVTGTADVIDNVSDNVVDNVNDNVSDNVVDNTNNTDMVSDNSDTNNVVLATEETATNNIAAEYHEVEKQYTVVTDTMMLSHVCCALMPTSLIILNDPDMPEHVYNNIVPTLIFVSLCDLPEETLLRAQKYAKEVRILKHNKEIIAPITDNKQLQVTYFDLSKFIEYVPIPNDMFSVYLCDKLLCGIYSDYKPFCYNITPESSKDLLTGIEFSNETLMEAIGKMIDAGIKCFEMEAEYCMKGRISTDVLDRCDDIRMLQGQNIFIQDKNLPMKLYKFSHGELAPYKEQYKRILGVSRLYESGIEICVYPSDNDEIGQFLDSQSCSKHFNDENNLYYYIIKYENMRTAFKYLSSNDTFNDALSYNDKNLLEHSSDKPFL